MIWLTIHAAQLILVCICGFLMETGGQRALEVMLIQRPAASSFVASPVSYGDASRSSLVGMQEDGCKEDLVGW